MAGSVAAQMVVLFPGLAVDHDVGPGQPVRIAIADAPGRNHCLECGDCVRDCEWMIERRGSGPVPRLLGFFSGPQRIDEPTAIDVVELAESRSEESVA